MVLQIKYIYFKILLVIVYIITLIMSVFFYIDYQRIFFKLNKDSYVTLWRRAGGNCYIIPNCYYGFSLPKNNFIEMSNYETGVNLFWDNKLSNTFYVDFSFSHETNFINKIFCTDTLNFKIVDINNSLFRKGDTVLNKLNLNNNLSGVTIAISDGEAYYLNGRKIESIYFFKEYYFITLIILSLLVLIYFYKKNNFKEK